MNRSSSRREFIQAGAAALAGTLGGCAMPATNASRADLILTNAKVATLDGHNSFADAVAIKNGRFLAVGNAGDILRHRGPNSVVVDAGRRAVIPGLNDSHLHLIRGGLNYNMELRWDGVPSLADALRMLKEQAARTPAPQWVRVVAPCAKGARCADEANAPAVPSPPGL
jgi:predicted amidohydrolase YtcJ